MQYLEQSFDDRHASARLTTPDARTELSRRTNCVSISGGRAWQIDIKLQHSTFTRVEMDALKPSQFANRIAVAPRFTTHRQLCHFVSTDLRPIR